MTKYKLDTQMLSVIYSSSNVMSVEMISHIKDCVNIVLNQGVDSLSPTARDFLVDMKVLVNEDSVPVQDASPLNKPLHKVSEPITLHLSIPFKVTYRESSNEGANFGRYKFFGYVTNLPSANGSGMTVDEMKMDISRNLLSLMRNTVVPVQDETRRLNKTGEARDEEFLREEVSERKAELDESTK